MSSRGSLEDASVLVTGATGFIGGRLARRLAREEGARVTGVGRRPEKAAGLREEAGVELVAADLTSDAAADLVAGREVVFHCAAYLGPDPETAAAVNVDATERLVRAAAAEGVRRFVHVSSIAVYGPRGRPEVDEDVPLATEDDDVYVTTKARGDIAAREAAAGAGLELAVARPGQVYGPGSPVWTVAVHEAVRDGRAVLVGDGSGHFFPVYIDDVVEGLLLCATSPAAVDRAFNFVDAPVPWRDYVAPYAELCGRAPVSMPLWLAGFFAGSRVAIVAGRATYSSARAREALGWEPRVPVEEGLRRTVAWLEEREAAG